MGAAPAVGQVPKMRWLRSGPVTLFAGAAVLLAVGLISIVVTTHRTSPVPGAPAGAPTAGPVNPAPEPLVTHTVRYELTGGAARNISYVTQGSGLAQVAATGSPWAVSLERQAAPRSSQYYSLSAQDTGQGTLKCRVLVDGTVISERSVTGPGEVVRCAKTLG
ncbi:MAG TPA: MmpS family transport accessory protein [Amycolatopsis sp.]|uniref:MmpS family transport accessory protein n=1 Tax=Amycolatopsis sp. TaxID=37632 RepID=UPI002B491575|nr:MmpS family transport accessory protein [Amycolatopsis sp.]HKS43802.1 MmpS family transport accessory protein [Amycolatopsis sp.]